MFTVLKKYGIPSKSLASAHAFVDSFTSIELNTFNGEFGFGGNYTHRDPLVIAKSAVTAVFEGADSVDEIAGFIRNQISETSFAQREFVPNMTFSGLQGFRMTGAAFTVGDIVVAPVMTDGEAEPVTGKVGRKRRNNSEFCRAVTVLDAASKNLSRADLLQLVIAEGISKSSAPVYLWRYNKGERF